MMKKATYIALLLSLFLIIASCTEKAPHPADTDTSHEGTSDIGTEHPDNPAASLAVIRIETETGQDVVSKEEYILSTFSLETEDGRKISASDIKIRGRGNQSWTVPKKSYRLKFPEKIYLLSGEEGKNKDWVLIAIVDIKPFIR